MSSTEYIANVIWIDDKPNDEILDNAAAEGLYLEHYLYVDAGMHALKNADRQWHAVIFDAKCKIHSENEVDNLDALTEGITSLKEINPDIPWFVLTAGDFEGEGAIRHIVGSNQRRPWDMNDKRFYTKLGEQPQLWADIKEALEHMPLYNTWLKYHNVIDFYKLPDLVKILDAYENKGEEFDKDQDLLHKVRMILETLFKDYCKCGLLSIPFPENSLVDCSKRLGRSEMSAIIPRYVQRSIHMCVDCCNPGSHRETTEDWPTLKLVTSGCAPYLNRMVVLALLNVLHWSKDLPKDEDAIVDLKNKVEEIDAQQKNKEELNSNS